MKRCRELSGGTDDIFRIFWTSFLHAWYGLYHLCGSWFCRRSRHATYIITYIIVISKNIASWIYEYGRLVWKKKIRKNIQFSKERYISLKQQQRNSFKILHWKLILNSSILKNESNIFLWLTNINFVVVFVIFCPLFRFHICLQLKIFGLHFHRICKQIISIAMNMQDSVGEFHFTA